MGLFSKQRVRAGLVVLFAAILFGANVGFTIYWNHVQESHACQALVLLTSHPVPYPANPAANPSRVTTYEFYKDLLYWRSADGC
jgi:hypothetical protein